MRVCGCVRRGSLEQGIDSVRVLQWRRWRILATTTDCVWCHLYVSFDSPNSQEEESVAPLPGRRSLCSFVLITDSARGCGRCRCASRFVRLWYGLLHSISAYGSTFFAAAPRRKYAPVRDHTASPKLCCYHRTEGHRMFCTHSQMEAVAFLKSCCYQHDNELHMTMSYSSAQRVSVKC